MRKILTLTAAIAMAFAFAAGPVLAAGSEEKTAEDTMGVPQSPFGVRGPMSAWPPMDRGAMIREGNPVAVPRADAIIGLMVLNDEGQRLGKVEDLTLSDDGRIIYLVIAKGGIFGFGSKLYAIPWEAANPRVYERALIVSLSEERMGKAPTFNNWAELKKGDYRQEVRAYYGERSGTGDRTPGSYSEGMSPDMSRSQNTGLPGGEREPSPAHRGMH